MTALYREIRALLAQIDFGALWPGFRPYPFALYTRRGAVLDGAHIPTPGCFYGNTSISYGGRQIAIWNVELDPPKHPDLLAADLVHEMFHAFQMACGEGRFPDDLALLAAAPTAEALAWRITERKLLAGGAPLSQFCAARLARRKYGSSRQEELVETAEGMAQFVELYALRQLSAARFFEALGRCEARLRDPAQAVDIRRSGYDSGAYLLLRAAESGMAFHHQVGQEQNTVFALLLRQVAALSTIAPPTAELRDTAARLLDAQKARQDDELALFYRSPLRRTDGPFQICGYDPMNLWRQGDTLFSRSFLALSGTDGAVRTLHGPALLFMEPGSPDAVLWYLTPDQAP